MQCDGDGYGSNITTMSYSSTARAGYSDNNLDDNDGSTTLHTNVTEVCNNGIDDNCNGVVDEGCNLACNLTVSISACVRPQFNLYTLRGNFFCSRLW